MVLLFYTISEVYTIFGMVSKRSYEAFQNHIQPNSLLIHDKENTHKKLVNELSLQSVCYASKDLKGLADSENPLEPVNRVHMLLKMFLNAHSGFCRDDIQDYLNLYSFVINPPSDHLEKVEKIVTIQNDKNLYTCTKEILKYRIAGLRMKKV